MFYLTSLKVYSLYFKEVVMGKKVPVKQYTKQGKFIKLWESMSEAKRITLTSDSSIKSVCERKLKTSNDFIWRYEYDGVTKEDLKNLTKRKSWSLAAIEANSKKRFKPVCQHSLSGKFIKEWSSVTEAAKALGIAASGISSACVMKQKKSGGFQWRYSNETAQDVANYIVRAGRKKLYNEQYVKNNKDNCQKLRDKNKKNKKAYDKQYRLDNKEKIKIKDALYYKNNKAVLAEKHRQYHINNKDKVKQYYKENKGRFTLMRKKASLSDAEYIKYHDKLTVDESPRKAEDGIYLEVKCRYCGKYFIPTNREVSHRINALNNTGGSKSLYCSKGCKQACPIYNQQVNIKGFKKATSREVQPQLRQMVLARDNWKCQICNKTSDEVQLHCHHILPINESPIESADISNCVTLCKTCHKEVHRLPGCNYYELRCSEQK